MTTFQKVNKAVKFLNSYANMSREVDFFELAYSGGKDSDVLLFLARLSDLNFRVVHKVTTIDPPFTLRHVQWADDDPIILRPKVTFFELMRKKGLPTMFRRFCCQYLKEYYTNKYVLLGVRRAESVKRSLRFVEPEQCRVYRKGKREVQILPMLDFTDEDIATIVTHERLNVHPLYYDADGRFDVTRRLGCVGCPLQSDRGKGDFLLYPKFLRLWYRNLVVYYKGDETKAGHVLVHHLFYSNHGHAKFMNNYYGLFPHEDFKETLQNYFKIKL